jgi:hypothetical protein
VKSLLPRLSLVPAQALVDTVIAGTEKVGPEVAVSRVERNVRLKRHLGSGTQCDLVVEELSCRGAGPFSISSWLEVVVPLVVESVVVLALY